MKQRSSDRSAACPVCGKTFARSDTLLRHEKSHHASEDRGPLHRVTSGTFRACRACAAARSRCSGGQPCGRCNIRNIECVYPNKRRKATDASENSEDFRTSYSIGPNPGFEEFVFSINPPTLTGTVPPPQSQQFLSDATTSIDQATTSGHHASTFAPASHQRHAQVGQLTDTVLYPNYNSLATDFDYGGFEDPINWIPLSVYSSPFDADLEQDFSFLPPVATDHGLATDFTLLNPIDPGVGVLDHNSAAHPVHHRLQPMTSSAVLNPATTASPTSSISDSNRLYDSAALSTRTGSSLGETKRRKNRSPLVPDLFVRSRSDRRTFAFPQTMDGPTEIETKRWQVNYCPQNTYDTIRSIFRRLCLEPVLEAAFETSTFPSHAIFNVCIELYFEELAEGLPIIHTPSFGQHTSWILMLAVAAIGSSFIIEPCIVDLRDAFQEFLRRAIDQYGSSMADFGQDIDYAISRILNLIGLVQSERDQLRVLAPKYHAELSRWVLESGLLQLTGNSGQPVVSDQIDSNEGWNAWVRAESLRRIGYMSWLLDCSLGYMANARPLCNIDDARAPLPSTDALWNATSVDAWMPEAQSATVPPSLCMALEALYGQKRADSSLSEWSHILLIHALYQRTWEVGTHIKQPLSEWVPTGKARGFLNTPSKDNFWLPLYPLYANWRNSACDCLDFLNWHAMEVVAQRSGFEPAVMLHLHLARIVLLTPFQEIQDLLFSLLGRVGDASHASYYVHDGSYQPRNKAKLPQIRKITWRWLREDQHKARLAVIHAGSVFWHVRRYSTRTFYEPLAVYLASVILWVYGTYKTAALDRAIVTADGRRVGGPSGPDANAAVQPSRAERKLHKTRGANSQDKIMATDEPRPATQEDQPNASDEGERSDSEQASVSEQEPEFIHLDRPCDDDIVQHFIRNGHKMTGYMSSVGDICQSPGKILQEGAKLLRTKLGCWGVSREYFEVLTRLSELRKVT